MQNYPTDRFEELASVFRALSNPNRLKIFMRLASCCSPGTVCDGDDAEMRRYVGEIGRELSIAPSTVSHHLKALRDTGLIRTQRRGQHIECWVDPNILQALSEFFGTPLGS